MAGILGGAYLKQASLSVVIVVGVMLALLLMGKGTRLLGVVLLCALMTGWVRTAAEPEGNLQVGDRWVKARVVEWESRGRGTYGILEAYRIGEEHYPTPRRLGFSAWDCPSKWESSWVLWEGRVQEARAATNPGQPSPRETGRFSPRGEPRWHREGVPLLSTMRRQFLKKLHGRSPGWTGRLGEAMLLGRSRALHPEEREMFRRAGLAHLTAVSGLHVGFVFMIALGLLGWVPLLPRCILATLCAFVFAGLAGFPPSACRAATLMGLGLCGGAMGRVRQPQEWVVLAVLWMTWFETGIWSSLSFQLSISAVMGILVSVNLMPRSSSRWKSMATPIAVSLGAQWGTLPWTLSVFGMVPVFALIPNILAVPLAGLFVPALGCLLVAPENTILFEVAQDATQVLAALMHWIAECSGIHFLCLEKMVRPSELGVVAVLVLGVLRLFRVLSPRVFLVLGALATASLFIPVSPPEGPWVCFLDVGQGDATVFRLSNGSTWLVDVGDDRGPSNAVSQAVGPFLRERRIKRLQGVVLTHPHRDHTGALEFLWARALVDTVYLSPCFGDLVPGAMGTEVRRVTAGDVLASGCVEVLHPRDCDSHSVNDGSVVLEVRDGPMELLLTGDLEARGERVLLGAREFQGAAILKVGHHGSSSSSTAEFISAVDPRIAVISCGRSNSYGHPDSLVVERLRKRGRLFRTDQYGALEITYTDGVEKVHAYGGTLVPE